MTAILPCRWFQKEYGELPRIKPYHNSSRRYVINSLRMIFFEIVFFYYLFLISVIVSTILTVVTGNPAGYVISIFFTPGLVVLLITYNKVKKDPDPFFRRHLKYSLTGMFTNEHDDFIYGKKRDKGISIPKRKLELLGKYVTFIILYISIYFLVLIQLPIQFIDMPYRIIFMVLSLIIFIEFDILAIRSLKRLLKRRFADR